MIIRSLELANYRNYKSLHMDFHPGTNLLYGDNAQGKTNALEAIFLCATSKSHRGAKDRELIRFEEEEAHIKLIVEKKGVPNRIDLHLKKGRSKGVAIGGIPIRRITQLFGIFNVIFFSPEDLGIVKNSPMERRRFMDLELCQLDRVYAHDLSQYMKVLSQRNQLLKDIQKKPDFMDTLDIWDEQLIRYGSPLIARREEFIREMGKIMEEIHDSLTGKREKISLHYAKNVGIEEFSSRLTKEREREKKAGTSFIGPHRDDLQFFIDGVDVRHFGSQGQQKTTALSLKLAEIELVKRKIKDTPILLLDDVLSELDQGRQKRLLEGMAGNQTILTGTGFDAFFSYDFAIDKTFHLVDGRIEET